MVGEKEWNKFILTGRVEDYLKFVNSCRINRDFGG